MCYYWCQQKWLVTIQDFMIMNHHSKEKKKEEKRNNHRGKCWQQSNQNQTFQFWLVEFSSLKYYMVLLCFNCLKYDKCRHSSLNVLTLKKKRQNRRWWNATGCCFHRCHTFLASSVLAFLETKLTTWVNVHTHKDLVDSFEA